MQRLIFDLQAGQVVEIVDPCEGTETGSPHYIFEGSPGEVSRKIAELSASPATVSARQIRLWLVQHGVSLAAVDSAIDSIPDQATRDAVRVEWEYAPYVERSHPWLLPMAQALGLDAAAIDEAFREAAAL